MEIIPIGQDLKLVERSEPAVRSSSIFVSQPGRIARDEPLPSIEAPTVQEPTTHPVLDLIYRPDIQRAMSESEPPRPVREYPPFDQRLGESVGNFLNLMV